MLSSIGTTLAKDSIFNGLDYRASNATGHIAPVGTLMNTVSSIVDDGDINKYGYYGAKRRILFDIVTTGGELYLFRKAGLFKGILYSTSLDMGLNGFKDILVPPQSEDDTKRNNVKEINRIIEDGMD